jgi:threonine dehydrogenase-like Zn-dependent dehydrogenase
MKALVFRPKPNSEGARSERLPLLPHLNLSEIAPPEIPDRNWIVIRSELAGICGSDLGMLQGKTLPAAEPYASLPFVPGHELYGRVEDVGSAKTGLTVGQRVVIDPTLACPERGFPEPCAGCTSGHPSRCERFAEGSLAPATIIGTCRDTGGGWGEYYVANASRVFPVPDEIPDDEAVLIEPFSVCLRAVLENKPSAGELIVVVGAGTIGLMSIAALRAVEPACRIACVAKHAFQASCAEALGAEWVLDPDTDGLVSRVAELSGSAVRKLFSGGAIAAGGAALVIDTIAAGNTLTQSLRSLRPGGTLLILALPSFPEQVDWSPMVFKELIVRGSFLYGKETFEGARQTTFQRAVDLLRSRRTDLRAITPRRFPLASYAEALTAANEKSRCETAKVVFSF